MDVLIRNGLLLDGTSSEPEISGVYLRDGKIAAVGTDCPESAPSVIDAAGKCVTPGFIDIHRHADAKALRDGFGELELLQGITSVVNGNCGLGLAPAPSEFSDAIFSYMKPILGDIPDSMGFPLFSSYMRALERTPLPLNVGCCVGNGALRMAVRGFDSGSLTSGEKEKVHALLKDALESGAMGVSLGLIYIPENNYSTDELEEVLSPIRDTGIIMPMHIRGEGDTLVKSIDEAVDLASRLGVHLHISHLKATGQKNWGKNIDLAIGVLDAARAGGLTVTADAYPYTAGASQLMQVMPPWVLDGGVGNMIARLRDPGIRRRITDELSDSRPGGKGAHFIGWDSIMISSAGLPKHKKYLGKTVGEISREFGLDPYECAYDLLAEEDGNVAMVNFIMDEADVIKVMRYPYSVIISDSIYSEGGIPHPRVYAAFTKFLSEYVRDRKIMPLPDAIAKITSRPAKVYGIKNKGYIRPGYDADVCVFGLDKLKNNSTFSDSGHLSQGMDCVFVNGKLAVKEGKITGEKNGSVLKR